MNLGRWFLGRWFHPNPRVVAYRALAESLIPRGDEDPGGVYVGEHVQDLLRVKRDLVDIYIAWGSDGWYIAASGVWLLDNWHVFGETYRWRSSAIRALARGLRILHEKHSDPEDRETFFRDFALGGLSLAEGEGHLSEPERTETCVSP